MLLHTQIAKAVFPTSRLSCLSSFQECSNSSRDVLRPGLSGAVPSLLSAFGAMALTSLQPLKPDGGCSRAALSRWQPSCYVSPDASYQAGVAAPASTLKGATSAMRRAATVAAGDCQPHTSQLFEHLAPKKLASNVAVGAAMPTGLVKAAVARTQCWCLGCVTSMESFEDGAGLLLQK